MADERVESDDTKARLAFHARRACRAAIQQRGYDYKKVAELLDRKPRYARRLLKEETWPFGVAMKLVWQLGYVVMSVEDEDGGPPAIMVQPLGTPIQITAYRSQPIGANEEYVNGRRVERVELPDGSRGRSML